LDNSYEVPAAVEFNILLDGSPNRDDKSSRDSYERRLEVSAEGRARIAALRLF
jgi:hypothetical protein